MCRHVRLSHYRCRLATCHCGISRSGHVSEQKKLNIFCSFCLSAPILTLLTTCAGTMCVASLCPPCALRLVASRKWAHFFLIPRESDLICRTVAGLLWATLKWAFFAEAVNEILIWYLQSLVITGLSLISVEQLHKVPVRVSSQMITANRGIDYEVRKLRQIFLWGRQMPSNNNTNVL